MADLSDQVRQTMAKEHLKPPDSLEPSSAKFQGGWKALAGDPQAAYALLCAQRQEFQAQLAALQQLVAVQAKCTGQTGLEEAVAGRMLGKTSAWKQAAEELPAQASKALEEAFSLKDTVNKAEARDLGIVLGITPGQVKDFFAAHRAHIRAWLQAMHPGPPKGRLKDAPKRKGLQRSREAVAEVPGVGMLAATRSRPGAHSDAQLRVEALEVAGLQRGPEDSVAATVAPKVADASPAHPLATQPGHSGGGVAGNEGDASALQEAEQDAEAAQYPAGMVSKNQTAGMQVETTHRGEARLRERPSATLLEEKRMSDSQSHLLALPPLFKKEVEDWRGEGVAGFQSLGPPLRRCNGLLPLEPFTRARSSHASPLDLNAAPSPEEPLMHREGVALEESPAGLSGIQTPAVLALGAPSTSLAGAKPPKHDVQREGTKEQGQLSQLTVAKAEAGDAIERLLRGMRRDGTVAGRLRVLGTLAKTRKREVHARLVAQGALPVLHRWLVEAIGEEQTSLIRAQLQLLDILPLHEAAAARLVSVARTMLQLTRYFVPDVQVLARRLCVKWKTGGTDRVLGPPQKMARILGPPDRPAPPGSAPLSSAQDARKQGKTSSPISGWSPQPAHTEAAAQSSSAAAALAPSTNKRASSLSEGARSLSQTKVPGKGLAKRAGSALAAPKSKQPRRDEPTEEVKARGGREGEARKSGKFAELLKRGRRRDNEEGEVAQLLRGAAALQSSQGEKPLSADDILKAKAREKLIRQMQGRAKLRGDSSNSGAGRDVGEKGLAKGLVLPRVRSSDSAAKAERLDAVRRVHSNGGPPQMRQDMGANHSQRPEAAPAVDDNCEGSVPSIDVATLSALAQMLQVPAPTPASRSPSPSNLEEGEIAPEPHAAPLPSRPANPLLVQLVAEVERQKQLQVERRKREGPRAGLSAEGAQSDALLQQLEQQVAALVEQERRQAAVQGGGWEMGGGAQGAWDRAVALMEDRRISWHVPAVTVLNPEWNVPAGEDSQEAPTRAAEDSARLAAVYSHPSLVPDNPQPPAAMEPDYDDALTPEITTLDPKQQQAAAATEAGGDTEDDDPEYQAALAEAYGLENTSAEPALGHVSWQLPPPVYPPVLQAQAPVAPPYGHAGPSSTWGKALGWQLPRMPYAQPPLPASHDLDSHVPMHSWPRGPPPVPGRGPRHGDRAEYLPGYGTSRQAPPRPYGGNPQPGSRPGW